MRAKRNTKADPSVTLAVAIYPVLNPILTD
jgi:hypothetical protein